MVKLVLVLSIVSLMFVGLAFGVGFEIGGGVNYLGYSGIGLMLPTICGGVDFPIFSGFSLTGQGDMLMFSFSGSSSTMFMLLGGIRYTFGNKGTRPFVGADGGALMAFGSTNAVVPVFGVNGGMIFNLFGSVNAYVKGAFRMLSGNNTENPSEGPTISTLQLIELTGGAYISF